MYNSQSKLIETIGTVQEIIDEATFNVILENGEAIVATISKNIKLEFQICIGEEVPIHMSSYDLKRGRIYYRYWIRERRRPTSEGESRDKNVKKNWF